MTKLILFKLFTNTTTTNTTTNIIVIIINNIYIIYLKII